MNLLVTGGAGFIGSHFVKLLLQKEPSWRVFNLDALTYAGHKTRLSAVIDHPQHTFIHGDICDRNLLANLGKDLDINIIINFAAESHVDRSISDATPFIETNIVGTQVLLDFALQWQVERFVQISTDEVYGELGAEGQFRENDPLRPSSPYSASKAAADLIALSYFRTYDCPVIISRSCNSYGPDQHREKLIPMAISKAFKNQKIPLYADGKNIRTWIHVRDNCEAIHSLLNDGKNGEVYNIASSEEQSNLGVVQAILKNTGKTDDLIDFVKDRPGHDFRYALDCSKISKATGWQSTIPFDQGLAETIEWFKKSNE